MFCHVSFADICIRRTTETDAVYFIRSALHRRSYRAIIVRIIQLHVRLWKAKLNLHVGTGIVFVIMSFGCPSISPGCFFFDLIFGKFVCGNYGIRGQIHRILFIRWAIDFMTKWTEPRTVSAHRVFRPVCIFPSFAGCALLACVSLNASPCPTRVVLPRARITADSARYAQHCLAFCSLIHGQRLLKRSVGRLLKRGVSTGTESRIDGYGPVAEVKPDADIIGMLTGISQRRIIRVDFPYITRWTCVYFAVFVLPLVKFVEVSFILPLVVPRHVIAPLFIGREKTGARFQRWEIHLFTFTLNTV